MTDFDPASALLYGHVPPPREETTMSEQIPTPPEDLRIRQETIAMAQRCIAKYRDKPPVTPNEKAELRWAETVIEWDATAPNPVVVSDVPQTVKAESE